MVEIGRMNVTMLTVTPTIQTMTKSHPRICSTAQSRRSIRFGGINIIHAMMPFGGIFQIMMTFGGIIQIMAIMLLAYHTTIFLSGSNVIVPVSAAEMSELEQQEWLPKDNLQSPEWNLLGLSDNVLQTLNLGRKAGNEWVREWDGSSGGSESGRTTGSSTSKNNVAVAERSVESSQKRNNSEKGNSDASKSTSESGSLKGAKGAAHFDEIFHQWTYEDANGISVDDQLRLLLMSPLGASQDSESERENLTESLSDNDNAENNNEDNLEASWVENGILVEERENFSREDVKKSDDANADNITDRSTIRGTIIRPKRPLFHNTLYLGDTIPDAPADEFLGGNNGNINATEAAKALQETKRTSASSHVLPNPFSRDLLFDCDVGFDGEVKESTRALIWTANYGRSQYHEDDDWTAYLDIKKPRTSFRDLFAVLDGLTHFDGATREQCHILNFMFRHARSGDLEEVFGIEKGKIVVRRDESDEKTNLKMKKRDKSVQNQNISKKIAAWLRHALMSAGKGGDENSKEISESHTGNSNTLFNTIFGSHPKLGPHQYLFAAEWQYCTEQQCATWSVEQFDHFNARERYRSGDFYLLGDGTQSNAKSVSANTAGSSRNSKSSTGTQSSPRKSSSSSSTTHVLNPRYLPREYSGIPDPDSIDPVISGKVPLPQIWTSRDLQWGDRPRETPSRHHIKRGGLHNKAQIRSDDAWSTNRGIDVMAGSLQLLANFDIAVQNTGNSVFTDPKSRAGKVRVTGNSKFHNKDLSNSSIGDLWHSDAERLRHFVKKFLELITPFMKKWDREIHNLQLRRKQTVMGEWIEQFEEHALNQDFGSDNNANTSGNKNFKSGSKESKDSASNSNSLKESDDANPKRVTYLEYARGLSTSFVGSRLWQSWSATKGTEEMKKEDVTAQVDKVLGKFIGSDGGDSETGSSTASSSRKTASRRRPTRRSNSDSRERVPTEAVSAASSSSSSSDTENDVASRETTIFPASQLFDPDVGEYLSVEATAQVEHTRRILLHHWRLWRDRLKKMGKLSRIFNKNAREVLSGGVLVSGGLESKYSASSLTQALGKFDAVLGNPGPHSSGGAGSSCDTNSRNGRKCSAESSLNRVNVSIGDGGTKANAVDRNFSIRDQKWRSYLDLTRRQVNQLLRTHINSRNSETNQNLNSDGIVLGQMPEFRAEDSNEDILEKGGPLVTSTSQPSLPFGLHSGLSQFLIKPRNLRQQMQQITGNFLSRVLYNEFDKMFRLTQTFRSFLREYEELEGADGETLLREGMGWRGRMGEPMSGVRNRIAAAGASAGGRKAQKVQDQKVQRNLKSKSRTLPSDKSPEDHIKSLQRSSQKTSFGKRLCIWMVVNLSTYGVETEPGKSWYSGKLKEQAEDCLRMCWVPREEAFPDGNDYNHNANGPNGDGEQKNSVDGSRSSQTRTSSHTWNLSSRYPICRHWLKVGRPVFQQFSRWMVKAKQMLAQTSLYGPTTLASLGTFRPEVRDVLNLQSAVEENRKFGSEDGHKNEARRSEVHASKTHSGMTLAFQTPYFSSQKWVTQSRVGAALMDPSVDVVESLRGEFKDLEARGESPNKKDIRSKESKRGDKKLEKKSHEKKSDEESANTQPTLPYIHPPHPDNFSPVVRFISLLPMLTKLGNLYLEFWYALCYRETMFFMTENLYELTIHIPGVKMPVLAQEGWDEDFEDDFADRKQGKGGKGKKGITAGSGKKLKNSEAGKSGTNGNTLPAITHSAGFQATNSTSVWASTLKRPNRFLMGRETYNVNRDNLALGELKSVLEEHNSDERAHLGAVNEKRVVPIGIKRAVRDSHKDFVCQRSATQFFASKDVRKREEQLRFPEIGMIRGNGETNGNRDGNGSDANGGTIFQQEEITKDQLRLRIGRLGFKTRIHLEDDVDQKFYYGAREDHDGIPSDSPSTALPSSTADVICTMSNMFVSGSTYLGHSLHGAMPLFWPDHGVQSDTALVANAVSDARSVDVDNWASKLRKTKHQFKGDSKATQHKGVSRQQRLRLTREIAMEELVKIYGTRDAKKMEGKSKVIGALDNIVKSESDGSEYILSSELLDRESGAITANDLLIESYRLPPIGERRKRGTFDETLQTSLDSRELFHMPYVDIEYIGDFETLFDFFGEDGKFRFLNRGYVEEYVKDLKTSKKRGKVEKGGKSKKRGDSSFDSAAAASAAASKTAFHFESTETPNVVPISGADGRAWRYQVLTALARQMQVKKMWDAEFEGKEAGKLQVIKVMHAELEDERAGTLPPIFFAEIGTASGLSSYRLLRDVPQLYGCVVDLGAVEATGTDLRARYPERSTFLRMDSTTVPERVLNEMYWRGLVGRGMNNPAVSRESGGVPDEIKKYGFLKGQAESTRNPNSVTALFDLVFLDGDHSYQGLLEDIQGWWPRVRKGGILAGHDYDIQYYTVVLVVQDFCRQQGIGRLYLSSDGVWWVYKE